MKCWHENFVSIFNPDNPHGCAYCPDCGKRPLSLEECGASILHPGFVKMAESIAKDLVADLLSKPPTRYDDLHQWIKFLIQYRKDYPYLNQEGIFEWIQEANAILADLK